MHLQGYVYQCSHIAEKRAYWVCRKYQWKECNARAITSGPADNVDETIADQQATSIKKKVKEHPEQPPAQLLRIELQGVDEVLSQLPSQPLLVRAMQRICRKVVFLLPQNCGISRIYLTYIRKHCSMNNSFSTILVLPLNHLTQKSSTPKKSRKKRLTQGLLFSQNEKILRSYVTVPYGLQMVRSKLRQIYSPRFLRLVYENIQIILKRWLRYH